MKKILTYILLLILGASTCTAQFSGGWGSGQGFSTIFSTTVTANFIFNAFGGGEGDGQASQALVSQYLDGSLVSAMFWGGFSDGESNGGLSGITFSTFPIVLSSFEATSTRQGIKLSWTAQLEMAGSRFVIERSQDGRLFQAILAPLEASQASGVYQGELFDNRPLWGRSFYRLKMTEPSGWMAYSNVQSIWVENEGLGGFDLYPNPSPDGQSLSLNVGPELPSQKGLSIEVLDLLGKKYLQKGLEEESFVGTRLDLYFPQKLPKGTYIIRLIKQDQKSISKRWLVR